MGVLRRLRSVFELHCWSKTEATFSEAELATSPHWTILGCRFATVLKQSSSTSHDQDTSTNAPISSNAWCAVAIPSKKERRVMGRRPAPTPRARFWFCVLALVQTGGVGCSCAARAFPAAPAAGLATLLSGCSLLAAQRALAVEPAGQPRPVCARPANLDSAG